MRPALLLLTLLWGAPALAQSGEEALTEARLSALRAYRTQRLQVKAYSEMTGGGTSYSPSFGLGPVALNSDPIRTVQRWGIFQGPVQVTLPDFYRLVGNDTLAADLDARIERNRHMSQGLYGVGVVGLVASAYGIFSMFHATDTASANRAQTFLTVGAIGSAVGMSFGGIPAGRARRLESEPSETLTPIEAQGLSDAYNEGLRRRLDLSPEDAARVELAAE